MMLDQQKHWWDNDIRDPSVDQVVFHLPVIAAPEYLTSYLRSPYVILACA